MPQLTDIPSDLSLIVYELDRVELPKLDRKVLLMFDLIGMPILTRLFDIPRRICNALTIPQTTGFVKGFKCLTGNLYVGKNVYLHDTFFQDYAPIYMEDGVAFSYRNILLTSTHDITKFSKVISKPIVLRKNVWITSNVTILGGVEIGENTIVGAGSVVTQNVPADVFAAGNPCRAIRQIKRG